MDTSLFLLALSLAIAAPALAITYLRPILARVLRSLCDASTSEASASEGAEFWIRSALLLAVSGTVLLTMVFGTYDLQDTLVEMLRRTLMLVMVGVFVSVGIVASAVWSRIDGRAMAALPAQALFANAAPGATPRSST